jgi:hypothetical protein
MATIRRRPRRGKAAPPLSHNLPQPPRPPLWPWQRPAEQPDRLCVGTQQIADAIEQPFPRVRHWIDQGLIASVSKRGRLHVAGRNALRREFGLDA